MSLHFARFQSVGILSILVLQCTLFALASPLLGQTLDSLSLQQVIQDVVRSNQRLESARLMERSAREKVGSAGAWDDPKLMLGVQNLPSSFDFRQSDMTMTMVGLSQSIPYSGYKGLSREAAKSDLLVSTEDRRVAELDLIAEAKHAYFDLYYRQKALRELQSQRELQQQVVASTTAKLTVGLTGQEEVLAAQAELWRLDSSILSAEQEVSASANRLFSLCGLGSPTDSPALSESASTVIPESPEAWIQAAWLEYPPLQRLKWQAESYSFAARASERMRWPMLEASVGYGFRFGNQIMPDGGLKKRDNMFNFGLGISLPFFSSSQQGHNERSMLAIQGSADAEASQLWRDVQSDLMTLNQRALRLRQSLSIYRDRIVPASEDAFKAALSGYSNSNTTFESLLMYASAVYRDRMAALQLENDLANTMADVERYTTDAHSLDSLSQSGMSDED